MARREKPSLSVSFEVILKSLFGQLKNCLFSSKITFFKTKYQIKQVAANLHFKWLYLFAMYFFIGISQFLKAVL